MDPRVFLICLMFGLTYYGVIEAIAGVKYVGREIKKVGHAVVHVLKAIPKHVTVTYKPIDESHAK